MPHTKIFEEGLKLHRNGQLDDAERLYNEALKASPGHVDILKHLAIIAYERGIHDTALSRCDVALAADPVSGPLHGLRGMILMALGRPADALDQFDRSLALQPDAADMHYNRGIALGNVGRHAEAIESFDRAIVLNRKKFDAFSARGAAHAQLGHYDRALDDFTFVLLRRKAHVEALNNRGVLLLTLKRYDEALVDLESAVLHAPANASAHSNLGSVLHRLGKESLALASVDKALALDPNLADAHQNRASILIALRRFEEAVLNAMRAAELKPLSADTQYALATALESAQHYEQAAAVYERVYLLDPKRRYLPGIILYTRMHSCLWEGFEARAQKILTGISAGQPTAEAYSLLAMPSTQAQQKKAAEMFVADTLPPVMASWPAQPRADRKIRIGYFSTDFRNHATAHLSAGLMECHDHARFEVIGFAFTRGMQDSMRERLSKAFDKMIDADDMLDQDLVQLTREMGIDIAVDLMGHNNGNRMRAFCHRLAPIQVTYLGYPGTTGSACMDYIIADPVIVPEGNRAHFAEKIAYLPHSYQINDSRRPISDRQFSRDELGLPKKGFVFSCFNNNYKLTPDVFDVWMRLLQRVEGSVLWLLEGNADAVRNLRGEAKKRGVDPARVIFAARMNPGEHLARHRHVDLVLDTFYYGAHTTASDALWMGVPVVTKAGETFAGRVGASLLTAVGLPELITRTSEEYESLALALAIEPSRLAFIKHRLAANRATYPLFNTALFARHIESAYLQMLDRYQAGLSPEHIHVRAE